MTSQPPRTGSTATEHACCSGCNSERHCTHGLAAPPSVTEPDPENVELLRRLDNWNAEQERDPGPLIRWAAAHLRGCLAPSVTEPETPAAPRTCPHGIEADCEQCWWIRIHEHRFPLFAASDAICTASDCTVTRGRAIEAEAAALEARPAEAQSLSGEREGIDVCRPVYGSCRLLVGHSGRHNAWAGIPTTDALEDALRYASAATGKPLDETPYLDLAKSMRRRLSSLPTEPEAE